MKETMRSCLVFAFGVYLSVSAPLASAEPAKILVFGGAEQDVYLGCLNCSPYDKDSVNYPYGRYGFKHSGLSIFNAEGLYGSTLSRYSPCNPGATFPPMLKNENGDTFGRLVLGEEHYQANKNTELQTWLSDHICKEK